jgi:hypothetical protein
MKVMVEISDDQVIAVLRETIVQSWTTCQPKYLPAKQFELQNLIDSASYCAAANRVIRHFGGCEVDLSALSPSQSETP